MLNKLFIAIFLMVPYMYFGQSIPIFNMKDTTVDDCDGNFLDSDEEFGGRYGKDENFTFTICPGLGGTVVLDFAWLNLEAPYDSISFYDGNSTAGTYLGSYTGQMTPGPTITGNSGCITVVFVSDGTLQLTGWDATWQTTAPPIIPPVMSISTTAPPACNSNRFEIEFDKNVHCDSIYGNAFNLTGPNAPPVQMVNPLNCVGDSTQTAEVILSNPLLYNCTYDLDFNLNILDICDSLWQFVLTDNFSLTTCQIPYQMSASDTVCINSCTDVEVITTPGCSPLTYNLDNGLPATAGPHNVCPTTQTTYHVTITETSTGIQAFDSVTVYIQDSLHTNVEMSYSSANSPQCGSNTFNVLFTPGLPCQLVDSGTFVFNTAGNPPQVASFNALNCTNGVADSVQVILNAPFSGDCSYALDYLLNFNDACIGPQNLIYSDTFDLIGCPISGTVNYPDTLCVGGCDSIEAIVNGCSSYSYTWSNGWPNAPGPFNMCPTADTSITVTITDDSSGMFYTETFSITVIPSGVDIEMSMNQTGLNCQSDSIVVNFSNPVRCSALVDTNFILVGGIDTINLSSITPINCTGGVTTSFKLNLPSTFNYNCDYKLTFLLDTVDWCGDSVRVTNTDSVRIVDCPLPYTINYTQIVCEDRCTQVRVNNIESCFGVHYIWSNGAPDTNRINICPDYDTVIYLQVIEDTTGLTIFDTIRIEVDSSFDDFTMELDSTQYLPACDSLKLFAKFNRPVPCDSIRTGDFRLRGRSGNHPITNIIKNGCVNPGDSILFIEIELGTPLDFYNNYTLYYDVNGNECNTNVNTRNIYIERHNTDFNFNDTCYYQTTQFNAVIDSLMDLDSVKWNFGDPTSDTNIATTLTTQHEFLSPGNYDVTFMAYYGCEVDTVIKTVTISQPLNVNITGRFSVCTAVTTTLDAGAGFTSYQWNAGSVNQATTVASAGQYDVTVTDGSGCSSGRDTIEVVKLPDVLPVITGPLSYCPGTGTNLDAGIHTAYQWSTGATTQTIYTNVPGVYSVTVYDTLGCEGYDTVEVLLGDNLPTSITGNSNLCPGVTTILDAGDQGYVLYQWSTGDTTQSITNIGPGNYYVYVRDTAGCSGYDTIDVSQYPEVDLAIWGDTVFCLGSAGYLYATPGYSGYHWSSGDRFTESIMVSKEDYYNVRVLDRNSCWAYDTIFVTTDTCIDTCNVIVPNAFSPNNDGVNDDFGITISRCEIEFFELSLYNRWGEQLFTTNQIENRWDGMYKDEPSESDVYIWKLRYKDFNDPRTFTRMGHVTIVK